MFQIDSTGRIARISISRPEARNAIAIAAWDDLAEAIASVGRSGARALIVRSAIPGIFCAGADISDLDRLQADPALRGHFRTAMGRAIETLGVLPIATIAVIDGGCFGAGVAVAMACDMRLAGREATFGITPARLGISYPASDVARLRALIGPGQAARLLYTAMTIDAAEAQAIGLIEEMADDAEAAAQMLAQAIAANAPSSIAALKRTLASDGQADALFDGAFGGADFAEGVAAFRARRRPEFPA
jgi:enoyl-CoA hydratase/carnithine racemase